MYIMFIYIYILWRERGEERERERGRDLAHQEKSDADLPERRALVCDSRTRYVVHSGFLVGEVGSGHLITTYHIPNKRGAHWHQSL